MMQYKQYIRFEQRSYKLLKGNGMQWPAENAAMPFSDDKNILKQPQPYCNHT
jgi:hypothetical protein